MDQDRAAAVKIIIGQSVLALPIRTPFLRGWLVLNSSVGAGRDVLYMCEASSGRSTVRRRSITAAAPAALLQEPKRRRELSPRVGKQDRS